MSIWHIVMLSAGAVAASTIANEAGPCSPEIYSMEARIEARLNAKAAAGSTAQESSEALLHRQPTPRSIAAAESRLGTVSPQKLDAITQGMARAREADSAGDLYACRRALSDVEPLLQRPIPIGAWVASRLSLARKPTTASNTLRRRDAR